MNCKKYISLYSVLIIAMVSISERLLAQATVPFVQTEIIKTPGVTTDAQILALSNANKQTTRSYYDGVGRTIQTVAVQASPNNKDIVAPVAYDALGRQTTGYLPYATTNTDGSYHPYALTGSTPEQPAYYANGSTDKVADDTEPYTQQVFENSPLQRLLSSGVVGAGYHPNSSGTQYYKQVSYRPGASSDNVILWAAGGTYVGSYDSGTAPSLGVTDSKDEDNVETLIFTDIAGRTILKRQVLNATTPTFLDTYYIYNTSGGLMYIVPPKAVAAMAASSNYDPAQTGTTVTGILFKYVYDTQGRLIEKTVPGAGVVYIIYDPMNRPVLLQDANLRANGQWNYIKYDVKGRAISQGIYTDTYSTHTSRSGMQSYVDGMTSSYNSAWYETRNNSNSSTGYYTNSIFPTANYDSSALQDLAYSYYDNDYTIGTTTYSYHTTGLTNELTAGVNAALAAQTRGMATAMITRTVGTGVSNYWLLKVMFYDNRGRLVQTQSNNHVYYTAGTVTDYRTMVPDFTGKPTLTLVSKQSSSSATVTVKTAYTYDNNSRPTAIDQYYNSGSVNHIAAYTYNEMGQLVNKKLAPNGSSALQSVDLLYNIRGQLLSINDSKLSNGGVFGMNMLYDQTDSYLYNGSYTPYHDGKLSAVKWMSKDGSGTSSYERSYIYKYDAVNRLTDALYSERTATSTSTFSNNVDGFSESGISYDGNGNITALNRNSSTQGTNSHTQIDQLTYSYTGNQLSSVTDGDGAGSYTDPGFVNPSNSTANYAYDNNGNMVTDPYKGLSLSYNILNRTDVISITSSSTSQHDNYTYDATGTLIRKDKYESGSITLTTDYIDEFEFENGTLNYFSMPEGRVLFTSSGGSFNPEFVIADQQGNARVSFQDNGSGTAVVKQENSYYAFGMIMPNSPVATPGVANKKLYNGGSEWQNDFGNMPNLYQTFYRNYDPALGRWTGVDPVPESAESMSSYQYAADNPIMYNDPLGDMVPLPGSKVLGGDGSSYDEFAASEEQLQEALHNEYFDNGGGAGEAAPKANSDEQLAEFFMKIGAHLSIDGTVTLGWAGKTASTAQGVNVIFGPTFLPIITKNDQDHNTYDYAVADGKDGNTINSLERLSDEQGQHLLGNYNLGSGDDGTTSVNQGVLTSGFSPIDGLSQISNMGTIAWGGAEVGLQAIRHFGDGQGPKLLAREIGFGTQETAAALRGTLGVVRTAGKYLGAAGQIFNTVVYVTKLVDPNAKLSTGDHVGFWTGTAVYGAVAIIGGPITGAIALGYGLGELGSWVFTGKSIEQHIFDR